jgi:hypothetical protein
MVRGGGRRGGAGGGGISKKVNFMYDLVTMNVTEGPYQTVIGLVCIAKVSQVLGSQRKSSRTHTKLHT